MNLLTIADIARQLGLAESTVRYYRDRFAEYIPAVGEGRARRYRPEALDVLRFIADAMRARTPAEDVKAALQASFPVNAEPQQQTAATQQQTAAAIEAAERRHAEAMERLHEQQEAQMDELRQWLETRLPPTEAKPLGLVARIRAMLGRDRRHG